MRTTSVKGNYKLQMTTTWKWRWGVQAEKGTDNTKTVIFSQTMSDKMQVNMTNFNGRVSSWWRAVYLMGGSLDVELSCTRTIGWNDEGSTTANRATGQEGGQCQRNRWNEHTNSGRLRRLTPMDSITLTMLCFIQAHASLLS